MEAVEENKEDETLLVFLSLSLTHSGTYFPLFKTKYKTEDFCKFG